MKKSTLFIIGLLCHTMISSCTKETTNESQASVEQTSENTNAVALVSWETVIPTNSFDSFSTYWNNLYPWG